MTGLIQVTANRGHKTISSEVFGDMDKPDVLFARLMNRNKIVHGDRTKWKLIDISMNKELSINKIGRASCRERV